MMTFSITNTEAAARERSPLQVNPQEKENFTRDKATLDKRQKKITTIILNP